MTMRDVLAFGLGVLIGILAGMAIATSAYAKDDPNLPIHAWCVPKTPQWPSCVWPPGSRVIRQKTFKN